MALDFPSSPVNGQTYNNYVWDSSVGAWLAQGSTNNVGDQIAGLQAKFPVSVANGGTGATSASAARTSLGIGSSIAQIVTASTTTPVSTTSNVSWVDSNLSATITPKSSTNTIICLVTQALLTSKASGNYTLSGFRLVYNNTAIDDNASSYSIGTAGTGAPSIDARHTATRIYTFSAGTTSAVVAKTQILSFETATTTIAQEANRLSRIILIEVQP